VELKFIKLNLKLAEMEFQPNDVDRKAAWALYVELITRIVLNRVVRPFTAEWHRRSLEGDLSRRPHRSRGQLVKRRGAERLRRTDVQSAPACSARSEGGRGWCLDRESLIGVFPVGFRAKIDGRRALLDPLVADLDAVVSREAIEGHPGDPLATWPRPPS
jgi:hypothetical protein